MRIIVREEDGKWSAYFEGDPSLAFTGKTKEHAVGLLICLNQERVCIRVQPEKYRG